MAGQIKSWWELIKTVLSFAPGTEVRVSVPGRTYTQEEVRARVKARVHERIKTLTGTAEERFLAEQAPWRKPDVTTISCALCGGVLKDYDQGGVNLVNLLKCRCWWREQGEISKEDAPGSRMDILRRERA